MSDVDLNWDLYEHVKRLILAVPTCPDGSGGLACASCLAKGVTIALQAVFES